MPGDSGNRSSTSNTLRAITAETAQYNQDDQLTQKGSDTYQYDANGRLSSKTTAQGTTTYQYGTRGELLSAQTPDTLVEYLHNPLGQRIAKKVDGQITEKYHWLNLTTLLATYDANGNVLQRYEYAGGRTPTKLTQNGQTYYLLSDYQGTPKLVTDTTGAVVKELSYDSFGNVIQDSNPTFRLPFGYAGGLYDPETQLVRFGHRDYDPDAGRWTARDPIGFGGGDYNLYGYVLGNPVNGVDPLGLEVVERYRLDVGSPTGVEKVITLGYTVESKYIPVIDAAKMFAGLGPDSIPRLDIILKGKGLGGMVGPAVGNLIGDVKCEQDFQIDQLTGEFNATYTVWDIDLDANEISNVGQTKTTIWRPIGDPVLVPLSKPYVGGTRWWFE